MASASTIAALTDLYKTVFMGRDLANQSRRRTPLYDLVSKYDDFDGTNLTFPFNQGLPVGVSASFSVGQSNPKPSVFDKWEMTVRKTLFGFLTIDAEAMRASRKDIGAWLRLRAKEQRELMDYMKMLLGGHAFWGDGAGDMAQVIAVTGADPVTSFTVTQNRAVRFHKNQRLQFAVLANRVSGGLKNAGATVYTVTAVNRMNSAGTATITVTRTTGAAAGDPAATDFVYLEGTYGVMPLGVQAFVPATDPGVSGVPTTLLGMDRSDDPVMKAGWRVPFQGSIMESAKYLASVMGQYHNSPTSALWLSTYNWFRLEQELESVGRKIQDARATQTFGSPALLLLTPSGEVPVVSDPYCPDEAGFMLDHDQIEVHHLDPLIHVVDDDGLPALRQTADNGIEIRNRSWSENIFQRPFQCGRFNIPAPT